MSFLSPEKIRSVRLKGSELVELERLELKLHVVVAGSAAALEIQEKGALAQRDLFPLLLRAGLAKENGDLLELAEVGELMQVLSLDELVMLTGKINAKMTATHPQKASPTSETATSNIASASPSAGPTPTT